MQFDETGNRKRKYRYGDEDELELEPEYRLNIDFSTIGSLKSGTMRRKASFLLHFFHCALAKTDRKGDTGCKILPFMPNTYLLEGTYALEA